MAKVGKICYADKLNMDGYDALVGCLGLVLLML